MQWFFYVPGCIAAIEHRCTVYPDEGRTLLYYNFFIGQPAVGVTILKGPAYEKLQAHINDILSWLLVMVTGNFLKDVAAGPCFTSPRLLNSLPCAGH